MGAGHGGQWGNCRGPPPILPSPSPGGLLGDGGLKGEGKRECMWICGYINVFVCVLAYIWIDHVMLCFFYSHANKVYLTS